jgi:hypothetical protein
LYLVGLQGLHLLQGFIICICFPASSSARLHLHLLSFKPLHPASRVHLFHHLLSCIIIICICFQDASRLHHLHHLAGLAPCFKNEALFKPSARLSGFKGASYKAASSFKPESPAKGFICFPASSRINL